MPFDSPDRDRSIQRSTDARLRAIEGAALVITAPDYPFKAAQVLSKIVEAGGEGFLYVITGGVLRLATAEDLEALMPVKSEDAQHTTGDGGYPVLGVRRDTETDTTNTDADYTMPALDRASRAKVLGYGKDPLTENTLPIELYETGASPTVATGAVVVAGPAGGSVPVVAEEGHTEDSPSSNAHRGVGILAVRNDADAARTSTDGDYGFPSIDSTGRIKVGQVVPGTGATHLGKAEDAAHATGDTGVMLLGVRNDADASLSGADGDYTPINVDDKGRVRLANGPNDLLKVDGVAGTAGASIVGYFPGDSTYRHVQVDDTGGVVSACATQQDTFTGVSTGVTDAACPGATEYVLRVYEIGGAATSWTVVLELSLDNGSTWTTIATHTKAGAGNGGIVVPATRIQAGALGRVRTSCTALVLGAATSVRSQFTAG